MINPDVPLQMETLREALLDLERARSKEEAQRQETEITLESLNVLARRGDPAEIFHELENLYRPLIGFEDVTILRSTKEGTWVPWVTTNDDLDSILIHGGRLFDRVLSGEIINIFEASVTSEWGPIIEKEFSTIRSVLHFGLQLDTRAIIVICTHSQPGRFSPSHVKAITRFIPILNQAMNLVNAHQAKAQVQELKDQRQEDLERIAMLDQGTQVLGVGLMQWDGKRDPSRPSKTLEQMLRGWSGIHSWWSDLLRQVPQESLRQRLRDGETIQVTLETEAKETRSFEIACSDPTGHCAAQSHPLLVSDRTADHALMQQRLRAEQRYQALFRESRDGIVIISMDGNVVEVNDQARSMLGEMESDNGVPWSKFVAESDRVLCAKELNTLTKESGVRFEVQLLRPEGTEFTAELSASTVELDGKEKVQALIRNVSNRKLAEKALRQSEMRKSAILSTALDCIISIDHHGKIIEFNPAAERTFGWCREEVFGRLLEDTILSEGFQGQHAEGFQRYMKTRVTKILGKRMELPAVRKDGQEILMEVAITETHGELGQPIFTAFLRDITQWKADQESLRIAKEEAIAANQAKSDFLASMSHELRTPLHIIAGLTELALEQNLQPEHGEMLEVIDSSSRTLLALIDDLLDLSKIEAGEISIFPKEFNLPRFIQEIKAMFAQRVAEQGLSLTINLDPGLPEWVKLDPRRLRQILINLLNNALKFTEVGGITLGVGFEAGFPSCLQFEVQDSGLGFAKDKCEEIFERFKQLDRGGASRRSSGSGLGLSISRELSLMMGGTLHAIGELGKGATFSLQIPIEVSELEFPGRDGGVHFSKENSSNPTSLRILVVDDHPGNLLLAERLLKVLGHRSLMADSGANALEILQDHSVDLVLMDIEMPEMDGFETLQEIRKIHGAGVPVVALTAHAIAGFREKCLTAGMRDYLPKPYSKADLIQLLERLNLSTKSNPVEVEADISDLIPGYLGRCVDQTNESLRLLSASDYTATQKLAHQLKGSGASYGFHEISRMGKLLHTACQSQDFQAASKAANKLRDYLEGVEYIVRRA